MKKLQDIFFIRENRIQTWFYNRALQTELNISEAYYYYY